MSDPVSRDDTARIKLLFAAGRRLGWIFQDPVSYRRPYRATAPPPVAPPDPQERRRLTGELQHAREARTELAFAGVVASIAGAIVGVVLAFFLDSALVFFLLAGLPVSVALLVGRQRVARAAAGLAAFDARVTAVHEQHADRIAAAKRDRDRHDLMEQDRVQELPEWSAAKLPSHVRRLDLFGGTSWGWEGLITVLGTSVLGDDRPLTILDLSGDAVAEDFARLAALHRHSVRSGRLPADLPQLDLLAGMSPETVVDVLIELIHHNPGDRSDAKRHHLILTRICAALGERVTLGRILAAVDVLVGRRGDGASDLLERGERRHIAEELFTDDYRASIREHLVTIESSLAPLRDLGAAAADGFDPTATDLLCLATHGGVGQTRTAFYNDLLVQWATSRVYDGAQRPGSTLLIAGADDIAADRLDQLANACDRRGIHLINLHRRLRRDALQAIGAGAVAFMRLGNGTEAAAAADFIGRGHRFVLSQLTGSFSRGETSSRTGKFLSDWIDTYGHAEQTNRTSAESRQRVYDYEVEPTTLQSIPEYSLLLVTHEAGRPLVRAVECNPGIVLLPKFLPLQQRVQPAVRADQAQPDQAALTDVIEDQGAPLPAAEMTSDRADEPARSRLTAD